MARLSEFIKEGYYLHRRCSASSVWGGMPDTTPDAARQRVLPLSGTGDLIVMNFLDEQSANAHSWREANIG
jgi:hypothetical protein